MWVKMHCWCQRSEENGQTYSSWYKGNSNSNNHSLQPRFRASLKTIRRTVKQMGYRNRRPHLVPLLSAKNRKLRLQYTKVCQNWAIEDWKKVVWFDESNFLIWMEGSEFGVHFMKALPCINGSDLCLWCNGVRNIFSTYFGPLSTH